MKKMQRARSPIQVKRQDILQSNTTSYLVLDFNGEGCFGKVAKCLDFNTSKTVAIKIHKESKDDIIEREVSMLEAVRVLDPDKNNIVRFMDNFRFHDLSCLAFEMLDMSLRDLMKKRKWERMSLNEIRPVTHQLLVAFDALKSIGIMHTDLKSDNIMLVNHKDQPFKIKLIDFGLARRVSEVEIGTCLQAKAYRAPEVTLGLPLSESIDMWGVGCIMAFLYFGVCLFPGKCAYHRMKTMVHLLGLPDDRLLIAGKFSSQYFILHPGKGWRLRTPKEYEEVTGIKPAVGKMCFDLMGNLKEAVMEYPEKENDLEYEDRMAFLNLLISCLHPHHELRITPREALKHNFVTMAHLVDKMAANSYTHAALQLMTVSSQQNSDESEYDGGYEDYYCGHSRTALTDLQKKPSKHHGKDSLTFSGYPAETKSSSGKNNEKQNKSYQNSNSLVTGLYADIESFRKDPVKLLTVQCHCGHSHNGDNADIKTTRQPSTSHPHDEARHPLSPTVKDDVYPKEPPGPSAATMLHDGFRDTVTSPKEEPGTSATLNNDHTNTYLPVASNIHNDTSSAGIPPKTGNTAGIRLFHAENVGHDGARRKNGFQRDVTFFNRLRKRVVSIFNHD